ncbi:asparagine synthase (glutamine-hydrolyzing) [Glaciimonas sp. CA11.2]|uniref:asparagine synthase (glutamine-hydrolyzing) n=1 Tax=Glaciimonas sp. CA11.2 TaxID=3048601 RepID=UPI002AB415EE|nr:asparagine synthase (glutamine-hydrolyzing) [Glaciimonas sp. CA11.2]MDY7545658.1 asparagine synthase (glutamine-hydrolyzing) [Glaciimonas sp. CA11.2]MEB0163387.1 asparagine synthase (glutamine-hydrolyzing) [Glaciimonas sp. CA11.2]
MCGLVAIFAYASTGPAIDREELIKIRDHMGKRGPDGAGHWISANGKVGLGHRRLAIIDLSEGGHQPMGSKDGNVQIIFNGEIYNFKELRNELEQKGHYFNSHSDTEVLLAAWLEWGEDMCSRLRGMYAFVIWDSNKQGLFLARDPFGIKPLYISDNGTTMRIASQVKALLAGGAIDTRTDAAGQVGFYLWGHIPEPYTLYKGVRSIPAGTACWISTSGANRQIRFFDIAELVAEGEVNACDMSPDDARHVVREAMLDTMKHHLIADVPVGIFLSSGVDSTALAALAKEVSGEKVHTLTIGFDEYRGTHLDEVPLAEKFARKIGSEHQTRWVNREEFVELKGQFLNAMDQPTIDGLNSYFVCKAAADAGFKVAISGLGGDELLRGYPAFRQIPRLVNTVGPFSGLPGLGRGLRFASAPFFSRTMTPKYSGLLEYGGSYGGAYLLRRALMMPWELYSVLEPGTVKEGLDELNTVYLLNQSERHLKQPHSKVAALEACWYMRNQLLRDSDWTSMAHSVELRVPLVDIPTWQKVLTTGAGISGKQLLGSAPVPPLPDEIVFRAKTGFSVPIGSWHANKVVKSQRQPTIRAWSRHVIEHFTNAIEPDFKAHL